MPQKQFFVSNEVFDMMSHQAVLRKTYSNHISL